MDYESESMIQKNMGAICKGRTVFIIAHRLTTVRICHRIFVLDKGRMLEGGPPRKLLQQKGAFYRMVMAQNQCLDEPVTSTAQKETPHA